VSNSRKSNAIRCDAEFAWVHAHAKGWQFGEVGMIDACLTRAGFHAVGRCCEFGAGDGETTQLITGNLIKAGWDVVLLEAGIAECARLREKVKYPNAMIRNESVTPDNVNIAVGDNDLVVIDVDGADYHIWDAYTFSPAFVLIEHADWCNPHVPDDADVPELVNAGVKDEGSFAIQANEKAIRDLGTEKGYTRIFATRVNSFFARNDVAERLRDEVDENYTAPPPDRLEIHELPENDQLPFKDDVIGEVYSCHVLEHYPAAKVLDAIKELVRITKPGGIVRISVPNFRKVAENYIDHKPGPWTQIAFGGQGSDNDFHKCGLDEPILRAFMTKAGLVCIKGWASDKPDASSMNISLNLEGRKPTPSTEAIGSKMVACMSIPRLGFTSNMFCAAAVCTRHAIVLDTMEGAFWGQCLERCIDRHTNDGTEFILTIDYDTVFDENHVKRLLIAADTYPEIDAFAPMQCKREGEAILAMLDDTGPHSVEVLNCPILEAKTAHFGLTLIRVSALKKMKHPWFIGVPNSEGGWWDEPREQTEEEFKPRTDDDIYFWHHFKASGNRLALLPDVGVGHAQLTIAWPETHSLKPVHQYWCDYRKKGAPPNVRS
jgi:SAM-dependent methyltransferase